MIFASYLFLIFLLVVVSALSSMIKHNFMDIQLTVSRTVSWLMVSTLFGGVYLSLVFAYQWVVTTKVDAIFTLWSTLYMLIAAILFEPLQLRLQTATDVVFLKGRYNFNDVMKTLGTWLAESTSTKQVFLTVYNLFQKELEIADVHIYIKKHRTTYIKYDRNNTTEELHYISNTERDLLETRAPISVSSTSHFKAFRPLNSILIIPIYSQENVHAFISIGARLNGHSYTDNNMTMFSAIGSQTGKVLELINQYTLIDKELKRSNAELSALNTNLESKIRLQVHEIETQHMALKNAAEEAESANQLKTEFLAKMSHEFRTPLHVILGMNELVMNSEEIKKKPDLEKPLSLISGSGKQLLGLVDDILDLQKLDPSLQELLDEPVNLKHLELEFSDNMQHILQHRHIVFKTEFDHQALPDTIYSDEKRIKQILSNLLSNAAKFTERGQITLTATLREPGIIQFSISDTGPGMTPDQHERIFDLFCKGDVGPDKNKTGAGLGLTISKEWVSLLGGDIWVESSPGNGATFTFWIPFREKVDMESSGVHFIEAPIKAQINLDRLKGKSLLVCDDNDDNRTYAKMIFSPHCKLTMVKSGKEAVERCQRESFDLILMDIRMPELTGDDALKIIRKIKGYEFKPIIATTAQAMEGDREDLIMKGFDDYIAKPFTPNDILECVSDAFLVEEKIWDGG